MRSRYLDLIVRDQARETVRARAKVNASLRQTFADRGYIEVETPMLQVQHGGASARPFVTRSNAFDTELYLRIAPELFLKRAVVGGLDRVFEINRNFRNEGADSTHSPEFAMLESYEAYSRLQRHRRPHAGPRAERRRRGRRLDDRHLGRRHRVRPGRSVGPHLDVRLALRRIRRRDHPADLARRTARARRARRRRGAAAGHPRQARRGALGALREGRPGASDVRDGLPARHQPARARAPLDRRVSSRSGICTSAGSSSRPATPSSSTR